MTAPPTHCSLEPRSPPTAIFDAGDPRVDVVLASYNEPADAVGQTLRACREQTHRVANVFVVDDGSKQPLALAEEFRTPGITLMRFEENRGISASRNAALRRSNAPFVACVNVEVIPDPTWIQTCLAYLSAHPHVGAAYCRMVPSEPGSIFVQWRMRFHEPRPMEASGPAPFAIGHAVFFRKQAIDAVGGYDERLRRIREDSDICERMRAAGFDVHHVIGSQCISTQRDTLRALSRKQLLRGGWIPEQPFNFRRMGVQQTRELGMRLGRNLWKRRFAFVPIDLAVWAYGLIILAKAKLRGAHPPAA